MHTRSAAPLAAALCALACASLTAQAEHTDADKQFVKWSDLMGKGSTFQLYGFLRTDAQWNDSRFSDPQIPGYVRSEDPTAASPLGAAENDAEFALHARLTRLGLDFKAPDIGGLGDPALTGNVEIDFYNIGLGDSDSRTAIRMRKAYLKLQWDDVGLTAGQDWDWISPLYPTVNADLVMWGAGNTGDRRPQVRVDKTFEVGDDTLILSGGIGLAGAVSSQTVVGGLRSGENSGLPMFAARLGYSGKNAAGGAWQLGVWGHWSEDEYDPAGGTNERDFESWSGGVDVRLPIYEDRLWVLGEAWLGTNLDDVRGGIFQGVDATTGREIEAAGGFAELGFKVGDHTTLHAGYSIDNPRDGDLSTGSRTENEVVYAAARWTYGALRFGAEYLYWTTEYAGFDEGTANRVAAYAAYYF